MFNSSSFRHAMRILISAVVALVVGFAMATTPAAAAKRPVQVSFSATKLVAPGGSALLKGKVTVSSSKKPVRKAKVVIQRKWGKSWAKVATVRTDRNGNFRYRVANVQKAGTHRAVVKKSKKYAKKISKARKTKVQQSISIGSTGATTITAGDAVTVTGTVTPGLRKKKLVLQRSDSGTWINVREGAAGSNGRFSLSGSIYGAGAGRVLRVVAQGNKGTLATSRTWNLDVYGWFYLSDSSRTGSYGYGWDDRELNVFGNHFPKSIVMRTYASPSQSWREFTVAGKCTALRASAGVDDSAASGATVRFEVFKDDVAAVPAFTKKVGQTPTVFNTSISGAFRIKLQATRQAVSGYNVGFGNAQVRCLAQP